MLVDLGVCCGCGCKGWLWVVWPAGHEVVGVCWFDGQLGALKRELDDAEADGGDAPEGDAVDALCVLTLVFLSWILPLMLC